MAGEFTRQLFLSPRRRHTEKPPFAVFLTAPPFLSPLFEKEIARHASKR